MAGAGRGRVARMWRLSFRTVDKQAIIAESMADYPLAAEKTR
jgi:hypothetical protein